jgi:putative transposase
MREKTSPIRRFVRAKTPHQSFKSNYPPLTFEKSSFPLLPQLPTILAVDRPVRKNLPHTVPNSVPENSPFFITINCEPRDHNHLCRAGTGDKILAAASHYHTISIWNCRLILLMPDHLHAVIHFPCHPPLQTIVSNWKKFLARTAAIRWQKDFFDHRLRDHHQLIEKMNYILMNPVRKRLCNRPEEWPWLFRGESENSREPQ